MRAAILLCATLVGCASLPPESPEERANRARAAAAIRANGGFNLPQATMPATPAFQPPIVCTTSPVAGGNRVTTCQ